MSVTFNIIIFLFCVIVKYNYYSLLVHDSLTHSLHRHWWFLLRCTSRLQFLSLPMFLFGNFLTGNSSSICWSENYNIFAEGQSFFNFLHYAKLKKMPFDHSGIQYRINHQILIIELISHSIHNNHDQ